MEFDLNKVIFQTHFSSHKFHRTLIIYTSSPSNSNAQRSCFPFADLIYWRDWRRRATFAPKGCLQLSCRLHLVFIIHRNLAECLHAQGSHVSYYIWENLLRFHHASCRVSKAIISAVDSSVGAIWRHNVERSEISIAFFSQFSEFELKMGQEENFHCVVRIWTHNGTQQSCG